MLRVGTILRGIYCIDSYLSSGGFGNTYVATNVEFDERVAIKEFFMKGVTQRDQNQTTVSVSNSENTSSFLEQKEKFKKEARRLRKLHNEHIVAVHDLFEENGTAYYVMDYIDGENLSQRLKRTGIPMTESEVCLILPQILDALKAIHKEGFCHLDIKPSNIMLEKGSKVKLIDFGASKQLGTNGTLTTASTAFAQTPGFAPREQIEQNLSKIGPWTDIYALGATLYNLLTNRLPPLPTNIDDDVCEDKHKALPFPSSTGSELKRLVLQMMNTNRWERPQSTDAVVFNGSSTSEGPKPQNDHIIETPGSIDNQGEDTFIDNLQAKEDQIITVNGVSFKMIYVEGGTFTMGATSEQGSDAFNEEKPTHRVTLSSYFIGETEVTQELWKAVMSKNPSYFKGNNRPVEQVSWDDCQNFIRQLNTITGKSFRLPTEAEWEFAARGGNKSNGYKYSGSNSVDRVAWYTGNSGFFGKTHDVKTKAANEMGIYDMSGNVWEWCQDWYGSYGASAETNPTGPSSGSVRMVRGGSWFYNAIYCRVATRYGNAPALRCVYLGLRLAL